jgi:hypothetical protein
VKPTPRVLLVVLAIAMTSAACSNTSMDLAPTAPGGVAGASGAVIAGRVTGMPAASTSPETFGTLDDRSLTVTLVGSGRTAEIGQGGQFTFSGVPAGDVQLRFSGRGINALVTIAGVSASDQIDITVSLANGSARLESERRRRDTNRVEVTGLVTARNDSARTFTVATALVTVPAGATIRHGSRTLSFTDIDVGDKVEVKGSVNGSNITATEVKVQDRSGRGDDDD